MGCGVSKSFVQGAKCEILHPVTYFCSSYITEGEINDLEKLLYLCYLVVSIYVSGALERSNNSYIESIVETCISMNQRGMFAMWV